jgi:hypothetical protein
LALVLMADFGVEVGRYPRALSTFDVHAVGNCTTCKFPWENSSMAGNARDGAKPSQVAVSA